MHSSESMLGSGRVYCMKVLNCPSFGHLLTVLTCQLCRMVSINVLHLNFFKIIFQSHEGMVVLQKLRFFNLILSIYLVGGNLRITPTL